MVTVRVRWAVRLRLVGRLRLGQVMVMVMGTVRVRPSARSQGQGGCVAAKTGPEGG